MRRLVSTMELRFIRQIVIPFLVLFFAISSVSAISEEFSPNQKEFSDSLEAYNKVRAQQIVQQARYEEQSQQKKKISRLLRHLVMIKQKPKMRG